jgi:hypothetical protein
LSFVRFQLVCSPYYPSLLFRGAISVGQLAEFIEEKPIAVIKYLMTDLGVMASITQNLDRATSAAVVEGFGWIVGGDDDEYEDDEDDE